MDLKYRLNEYRQQIIFYKDLYRHYLKYGIHFDRTGQYTKNYSLLLVWQR